MNKKSKSISKNDLRSTAGGIIFMAIFGTMWSYLGVMGLQGFGNPWVLVISLITGISLLIGAYLLIYKSHKLSNNSSDMNTNTTKNMKLWFNVIFGLESLLIFIATFTLNKLGNIEIIPFAVAIIVGIHFLPLAYLYQIKIYYLTGILMILISIFTWLFIPLNLTLQGNEINTYMSFVGFGSAITLWITSFIIWINSKRLLTKAS